MMEKRKAAIFYSRKVETESSHKVVSDLGKAILFYGLRKVYPELPFLEKEPLLLGIHKKPSLKNYPQIHYNISHSKDYVICAIADCEVGIDIQFHKKCKWEAVAYRTLSAEEWYQYQKSQESEKLFFDFWTQKESYLKWTGEGITKDLRYLSMEGWHQMLDIAVDYSACIWAGEELEVRMEKEIVLPLMY